MGPAYATIDDAKKTAEKAGATLASNPIYATAAPGGSQAKLVNGSKTNLVDNPVYSDAKSGKRSIQMSQPSIQSFLEPQIQVKTGSSSSIGQATPTQNPGSPYILDSTLSTTLVYSPPIVPEQFQLSCVPVQVCKSARLVTEHGHCTSKY